MNDDPSPKVDHPDGDRFRRAFANRAGIHAAHAATLRLSAVLAEYQAADSIPHGVMPIKIFVEVGAIVQAVQRVWVCDQARSDQSQPDTEPSDKSVADS